MRFLTFFRNFLFASLVLSICSMSSVYGQDEDRSLKETLQLLSEDAAKEYVKPISSAFGSNLNGGWFHRAPGPVKFGFNLEFGIVAMGSFFPEESKAFATSGSFRFSQDEALQLVRSGGTQYPAAVEAALVNQITSQYYDVEIAGATVTGDPENHIIITYPGYSYTYGGQVYNVPAQDVSLGFGGFKELADANALALFAPQFSFGTIMGTKVNIRFLPNIELQEDLGSLKYFGFGIQHNPEVYLPFVMPLDMAFTLSAQRLEIGDLFKTTTTSLGMNASKQFGPRIFNFTPYAGLMIESSKMNVTYDFIVETPVGRETTEVDFDLEGENKARMTFGFNIRFLLVNLNFDYNIGKYNSVTGGLFVAF